MQNIEVVDAYSVRGFSKFPWFFPFLDRIVAPFFGFAYPGSSPIDGEVFDSPLGFSGHRLSAHREPILWPLVRSCVLCAKRFLPPRRGAW